MKAEFSKPASAVQPELDWSNESIQSRFRDAVAFMWATRRAAGAKGEGEEEEAAEDAIEKMEDDPDTAEATDSTRAGKHMDGFSTLLIEVAGLAGYAAGVHVRSTKSLEVPGYFRATKKWDLLVDDGKRLLAAVELKSMGASYGKNMNNRTEEATGSATDIREAVKNGIIGTAPWLGYLYVIREESESTTPRKTDYRSKYTVDSKFERKSYVDRYGEFCKRLKLSGLYNETAYIVSPRGKNAQDVQGLNTTGSFTQPVAEAQVESFLRGFYRHLAAQRHA